MGFGSDEDKEEAQHLKLRTVRLGMSSALGGEVQLDFSPRTTVLVGKNGAGKSAILERMSAAFRNVVGIADPEPDPGQVFCEFDYHRLPIRYQCTWFPREELMPEKATGMAVARIEEKCAMLDPVEKVLWTTDDGLLVRNDGTTAEISPGRTLINWWIAGRRKPFVFNNMVRPLFEWFNAIGRVATPAARTREEVVVPVRPNGKDRFSGSEGLAYAIARWEDEFPDEYSALVELGRRTKLFNSIVVKRYVDPDNGASPAGRKHFVSVIIDGIDLGLLSDGTLRSIRIFLALLDPKVRFLMIDDPESAAHPGLLSRILNEIEAHSDDRQIVLATQSPQVVNWATPDVIRLVERIDGSTRVRALDPETLQRVERYLHDDDSLGSFIYGGGLDGLGG